MFVRSSALFAAVLAAGLCASPASAQDPDASPQPVAPAAADEQVRVPGVDMNPAADIIKNLEPEYPPAGSPGENVWSRGVSDAQRAEADRLFQEGNKLMRESITITAAARYREALTHWDHPNIHFNLGIALMALDQPVECYEHLQQATKYGAKPLEEERYQHAKNYLILLDKQLAHVQIRCDVPDAVVDIDGRQLFTTPGEWNGLVRAGRHTLVARREGYVTNQSVRIFDGGQTHAIQLDLKTLAQLTTTTRRWSAWKPWVTVVGGAAVLGAGVAATSTGNKKIVDYDRQASIACPSPGFCTSEPANLAKLRKDGRQMQVMGVAGYAVGGAALLTGAVLVVMNRGKSHVQPYDNGEKVAPPGAASPTVELSPLATPDVPGLAVRVRF